MTETFVDLFSGAGGLSWGLKEAGMTCLLASDHWEDALTTYRHNMPDHEAINSDIRDLTVARMRRLLPEKPDWIVGGPPCQGYSTVGKRNRADPRNVLFMEFRRIVKGLKPKGFLIENVLGLKDMSYEQEVTESFKELGYSVRFLVLTSAEHGVPQLRRRVVFVGHKERGFFNGPPVTHDEDTYISVADAIFDLPPVGPGESVERYSRHAQTPYQKLMRDGSRRLQGHIVSKHPERLVKAISYIPDGGNRQSIPPQYQPRAGFHNSYSRLASWRPAVAITQNLGKPSATRCIHPTQDRGLTTREGARLQSFPDRFHFLGGVTSQRLQIGNAVPPLLAQAVGEALQDEHRWF
ncbi:DNA cytosine methyltransferase [Mycobacteroides abscessus]|uniref:DNA cytosine methyltransferase n=1 Tax=Mycobacteroides abscessus TaxID=36809 RepID=UPI000940A7FF|nr:DNA cytosine methyltransferase [Mycobacteroides abscessus]